MSNWFKNIFVLTLCTLCFNIYAQSPVKGFVASGDIFGTRLFRENKGQYSAVPHSENILYALEYAGEKIYFTKTGLVYELRKEVPVTEEQREAIERGENVKPGEPEIRYVNMTWVNAHFNEMEIEASEKQHHYITYGTKEYNASTFKKLTYKNVYKNIDVEFIIPEDKIYGIEYSVIARPGADVSQFKIWYSGEVEKIELESGQAVISTPLDDITEHAPLSFYDNRDTVKSEFVQNGDTLSFRFPEGLDKNRNLVIDPWVTAVITLTPGPTNIAYPHNLAYDVDYDINGNVFIYGAAGPYCIAKYNPSGILQWTFGGAVVSPTWTSAGFVSNFAVERLTGKCYTGQGFVSGGTKVIRIDSSGNYDNFITVQNYQTEEIWDFGTHCQNSNIYVLGGGTSSNISAATINTSTAMFYVNTFQPNNPSAAQDVLSHATDYGGNLFVIYAGDPTVTNKICRVSPSFSNNVWTQPSSYTSFHELGNKGGYSVAPTSNGYNALAVNGNYLFYYDGYNLAAYNNTFGTMTASTAVPGVTLLQQGGIAVDECNNIYLGGRGTVLTYSFDGINFTPLTPITVSASVNHVYDIMLNKATRMLYVCGKGIVASYFAGNSYTCPAGLSSCLFDQPVITLSNSPITCATPGSATVNIIGGLGPYSYTWVPGNQSGSVAIGLIPGSYTVYIYDAGNNALYTRTVNYVSPAPFSGSVQATTMVPCYGSTTGTAMVVGVNGGSGSQLYQWTNGTNTYTLPLPNNLGAGNYTVTVTDSLTQCSFTQIFLIQQPVSLSVTIISSNPAVCVGQNATLTAIGSGGSPPLLIKWLSGPAGATRIAVSDTAGVWNYSVMILDSHSCTLVGSLSQTFIPNPVITVSVIPSSEEICSGETLTLVANGAFVYRWEGPYGYYSSGGTVSLPGAGSYQSGIYTLTGVDGNNCSGSTTLSLQVYDLLSGTLQASQPEGCVPFSTEVELKVQGSMFKVQSEDWKIFKDGISLNPKSYFLNPNFFYTNQFGNYQIAVNITDTNGCSNTIKYNIMVHEKPIAQFTFSPINPTEDVDEVLFEGDRGQVSGVGNAEIIKWNWIFGTSPTKSYILNPVSLLFESAGAYPVVLIVENNYGCKDTVVKTITVDPDFAAFVPNAFSPNQDNKNETFFPVIRGANEFTFEIFNRWGERVFITNTPNQGWDGTYKGQDCKQDTFEWKLKVISQNSKGEKEMTGSVMLIR